MGAEPAPECRGPLSVSSSSSRSRSRVGWGLEEEVEALAAALAPAAAWDEDDDDESQGKGKKKGGWWPPGFRFHPTDEELVLYYLKRKICRRRFRLPIIADLDVYKLDPWDLPDKSQLRSGDKQWYFFSPRDKKYPNGSRSNRATKLGYWKATGKDRTISQDSRVVGNKKTLVYYHGRAPRGERTDWVMHEYTIDEKVLASYNNVQDSYAVYKLFRKSGLGPKNGEQYGAPFREEEWDDGDDTIDDNLRNPNNREGLILEQPKDHSLSNMSDNNRDTLPIGVLEDLLPQMSSEQDVVQQYSEAAAFFSEVDFEGETGSCLAPHVEVTSAEHDNTWCKAGNMDISFEIAQLTSADPNPIEMSQITSFSSCIDQGQLRAGEEFLEIEDFNNPETGIWNTGDTGRRDQAQETNGLHDLDEYFDASMFIAEAMGPLDGATSNSYFGIFGDDEGQNQACHITTELWAHEQALNLPAIEPNQITMASSSSGIVNAHTLPAVGEQTLGQVSLARGGSDSWFGSALSAFLESIPSHPALASENALISRAFVRVSSFGAQQMRARDQNTQAGGGTTVGRRGGNNGGGFLFVSLLVGLGAILWVLTIGAAVKVVKGLWGRFISS